MVNAFVIPDNFEYNSEGLITIPEGWLTNYPPLPNYENQEGSIQGWLFETDKDVFAQISQNEMVRVLPVKGTNNKFTMIYGEYEITIEKIRDIRSDDPAYPDYYGWRPVEGVNKSIWEVIKRGINNMK